MVEGLGNLARFTLTAGQTHDVTQASDLLSGIDADSVAADKAYDADGVLRTIADMGAQAVIPPKETRLVQRSFDHHLYRHRNLIERFFCRLKQFRRIATRYDKLASRFAAFVALAAVVVWLA